MTPAHRRYLFVEQGGGSIVVNLAINAGIAWLMFRNVDAVPLWGQESIAGDTIGTTFFLPFFTCLIVTRLARHRVAGGGLSLLDRSEAGTLAALPSGTVRRGALLGILSALVVAPPTLLALYALDGGGMSFHHFLLFKALFAAALGAVVTPMIALVAITKPMNVEAPSLEA